MALINGQLKNAQAEILDTKPTGGDMKGRLFFERDCNRLAFDDGMDCKRVATVDDLMPVGAIMIWACESAPAGDWVKLTGIGLSTTDFPDLFDVLGYKYGGSGATFNVPDYRGEFLRGVSYNSGNDPDTRFPRPDGNFSGSVPGTEQAHAIQCHDHSFAAVQTWVSGTTLSWDTPGTRRFEPQGIRRTSGPNNDYQGEPVPNSDIETRPRNISVDYYIKSKPPCPA